MKLIIANWKMNKIRSEAKKLARVLANIDLLDAWVGICPPALWTADLATILKNSKIKLGGQDCTSDVSGAHTGDLSAKMFFSVGCTFCLVGHSERRIKNISNIDVAESALSLQVQNLLPVVCVGETLEQRRSGNAECEVKNQLEALVNKGIDLDDNKLVIAYEPIWAIGTGQICDSSSIASMHKMIRDYLGMPALKVLYGGSVGPQSAEGIFGIEEVSGALVGGASLDASSFESILKEWNGKC